jgi:protein TonB
MGVALGVGAAVVVLAGAAAYYFMFGTKPAESPAESSPPSASSSAQNSPAATATPSGSGDEQVDSLLERATKAMLDRRYIDPPDNSALTLYRNVLGRDPDNAEATQGLARLAQLLLTKAETALDQRRFDAALQALEIARSIIHDDPRVKTLDARVLQLRAELGSSVIQASINAGNFDRAAAQIDEAARTKSLAPEQIAQLRDDLRRRQDADADRLAKLALARAQQDKAAQESRLAAQHNQEVQSKAQRQHLVDLFNDRMAQGKLTEPENDSAAYYLSSLKAADPQNTQLADMSRTLQDGIAAHTAAPQTAKASSPAQDVTLKLLKPINPAYPFAARAANKEGWVDLAFSVAPDGRVANIHVAAASPPGLFDHAAVDAMTAARYEAIPRDQPQVTRDAKLRLKFKLQ